MKCIEKPAYMAERRLLGICATHEDGTELVVRDLGPVASEPLHVDLHCAVRH